jgi:hypothetical protein
MITRYLPRVYLRHRYTLLFYSLLLTVGVGPLVNALHGDVDLVRLFLDVNLVAAVFGVTSARQWRPLQLALALVLVARIVTLAVDAQGIDDVTRPLAIAIGLATAVGALRFALRARRVDNEHVYAALSAYLLAGIFGGLLYHEIEGLWPGSFASGGAPVLDFSLSTAIYFSFVTLATLGYGDIVPQSDVARGITVVEAVLGQLYLAVLIARLVSVRAHLVGREHET